MTTAPARSSITLSSIETVSLSSQINKLKPLSSSVDDRSDGDSVEWVAASVVVQTAGFQQFGDLVLNSGLPALLSLFGSISVISAITGSASGGLQIFMQTMAQDYVAMGLDPEVVHRVATMAAGGFDSLPHCGAVITMLTITQLTHKEAYRDTGIITVVIPVIATLTIMAAATLGLR